MDYRLKNTSAERFVAEGVDIAPKSVSVELSPEVYQRLLALFLGNPLMPMDEEELAKLAAEKSSEPEAVAEPSSPESSVPVEAGESSPAVEEPKKKPRVSKKPASPKKKGKEE